MNNPASQNITILHDTKEWSTDLDGEIGEIRVDGQKLNDIHDLTAKIDKMASVIRALALTATFLAVVAVAGVSAIGAWLASNHEQISDTMDTAGSRFSQRISMIQKHNVVYAKKLTQLGWAWENGEWPQIGNTAPKTSK